MGSNQAKDTAAAVRIARSEILKFIFLHQHVIGDNEGEVARSFPIVEDAETIRIVKNPTYSLARGLIALVDVERGGEEGFARELKRAVVICVLCGRNAVLHPCQDTAKGPKPSVMEALLRVIFAVFCDHAEEGVGARRRLLIADGPADVSLLLLLVGDRAFLDDVALRLRLVE